MAAFRSLVDSEPGRMLTIYSSRNRVFFMLARLRLGENYIVLVSNSGKTPLSGS